MIPELCRPIPGVAVAAALLCTGTGAGDLNALRGLQGPVFDALLCSAMDHIAKIPTAPMLAINKNI